MTQQNVMHFHAYLTKMVTSATSFPYGNPYF